MTKRRPAIVLVCGLIGLLSLPAPSAQAARTGPLTVEVEAVFGSPLPSGFVPFTGEAVFSGVFSQALPFVVAGLENAAFQIPSINGFQLTLNETVVPAELQPILPSQLVCSAAIGCMIGGGLIGFDERLIITAVELREGGRFAFRIEFPVVFCPRCPDR